MRRLLPLLLAACAGAAETPAPTPEQQARAQALLAELTAEDALVGELEREAAASGLAKDDILLLRALEFDLLEAERWLERRDPAYAGEPFLRVSKLRQGLTPEQVARLGKRLTGLDRRLLAVARALMRALPAVEPVSAPATGQDDGVQAVAPPAPRPDQSTQAE